MQPWCTQHLMLMGGHLRYQEQNGSVNIVVQSGPCKQAIQTKSASLKRSGCYLAFNTMYGPKIVPRNCAISFHFKVVALTPCTVCHARLCALSNIQKCFVAQLASQRALVGFVCSIVSARGVQVSIMFAFVTCMGATLMPQGSGRAMHVVT